MSFLYGSTGPARPIPSFEEMAITAYDRQARVWRVRVGGRVTTQGKPLTDEDGTPLAWDRFTDALSAADAYNDRWKEQHSGANG